MAGRKLELAQNRRDVGLDGLHRDAQPLRDLLVEIAARDVLDDLALARRELVELHVARRSAPPERVEDEAGQTRGEHGVALVDAPDRVGELVGADALRHVAARARADDRDHVGRVVGDAEGEVSPSGSLRRITSTPPPSGMWTSSSTTSGPFDAMAVTASSTDPASPTTSTRPCSSARTPRGRARGRRRCRTEVTASARLPSRRRARRGSPPGRRGAPSARRSTRGCRGGRRGRAPASKPGPRSRTNALSAPSRAST